MAQQAEPIDTANNFKYTFFKNHKSRTFIKLPSGMVFNKFY